MLHMNVRVPVRQRAMRLDARDYTDYADYTPTPMKFLRELLRRPVNETAVLVLPVGYPAPGARVPKIERKPLEEIVQWNR